jgi:hypothetical protein
MKLVRQWAHDTALRVSHRRAWIRFHGKSLRSRGLAGHVLVERVLVSIGWKKVGRGNTRMARGPLRRALVVGIVAGAIGL